MSTLSSATPLFVPLHSAPRPKSNSSAASQSSVSSRRLQTSSGQRGSGPVCQRLTPRTSSTTTQRDVPRLEMSMTPSILTSPAPESATAKYCRLVSPPSDALLPLVFPSGSCSLGELSQTQLEQGMREMSLVLEDMIKGSHLDRDSSWGLDPEGRHLVVGHPERNFNPNERFHGDPMYPEFYE